MRNFYKTTRNSNALRSPQHIALAKEVIMILYVNDEWNTEHSRRLLQRAISDSCEYAGMNVEHVEMLFDRFERRPRLGGPVDLDGGETFPFKSSFCPLRKLIFF